MKLITLSRSNMGELLRGVDALVTACGYEKRSATLAPLCQSIKTKVAIAFREYPEALNRPKNERLFSDSGFRIEGPVSGSDGETVERLVSDLLRDSSSIAFDISSMTRAWHGAIVRALKQSRIHSRMSFFFYVPAKFSAPPEQNVPVETVKPLEGFASFAPPTKPVALILGLGYERERALALQELLDPGLTILMAPNSGAGDPFYRSVLESNKGIIERTPKNWVIDYPLHDPLATYRILESVTLGLESDFRIVLASLGPKLYAVVCILLSAENPIVSVWRVTSGTMGEPRDAEADMDRAVVFRTRWAIEEILNKPLKASSLLQEVR